MRVDYESAWRQLQDEIAQEGHPQRGQKWLMQRMAQLPREHEVSETMLERALRVMGLPLVIAFADALRRTDRPLPEPGATGEPDSTRAATPPELGPPMNQEVHDGRSTDRAPALS